MNKISSEIDQLIFEKQCPFAEYCQLHEEIEEKRAKIIVLEHQIDQYKNAFHELLSKVTETFALRNYVERLSKISGVEAIYLVRREKILDIWTLISQSNLIIEEKIAEVQCELLRIYKELELDFMVLPISEAETAGVSPSNAKKIFPNLGV